MTIKNSLISVATASLLIAGLAGCGSSSSTTAATTTNSSLQTSVKAVDGYIYNATVKAFFVNEDNTTMDSITMAPATQTTKNTSTDVSTVGSSTYSFPSDTNDSVKNRVKFFQITTTSSLDDGNVTFTPAAYIEADGIAGYDVNDTLLGTTVIYAPANFSIASPLTSLIYSANTATLGSATTAGVGTIGTSLADMNTSILTAMEANATKLATNLGLSGVNLLTADPIELAATNPTFKLVTALLKGAGQTTADAILALTTAPTTFAETVAVVADNIEAGAPGATLAASLKTLANNGAFTASDVAALNIEKSVENNAYTTLAAPTLAGNFPINSVKVGGSTLTSALSAAGAKFLETETIDINMSNADSDTNVSATTFNLLVSFTGSKSHVADDANVSSTVVAKIPFDMNITDGAVKMMGVGASTIIPMQAKAKDGSVTVNKSDINATDMGLNGTTLISIAGTTDIVNIDVDGILDALVTAADANLSTDTEGSADFKGSISNVQILLQDPSGKIIGVDAAGTNTVPLPKSDFSDIGLGSITGAESIKLLSLSTLDMRAIATGVNDTPDGNISFTAENYTYGATSTADTNASQRAVVNNNTAYSVLLNPSTNDTFEENTTAAFTFGSMLTDTNSSYLSTEIKKNSDVAVSGTDVFDVNTTSTTAGELNTTITQLMTDEFGETNTTVYYLTVNRAPVYLATKDANGTRYTLIQDYDANDINSSQYNLSVMVNENNNSTNTIPDSEANALDFNVSDTDLRSMWLTVSDDNSTVYLDLNASLPSDANITIEVNATDISNADLNVTAQAI